MNTLHNCTPIYLNLHKVVHATLGIINGKHGHNLLILVCFFLNIYNNAI